MPKVSTVSPRGIGTLSIIIVSPPSPLPHIENCRGQTAQRNQIKTRFFLLWSGGSVSSIPSAKKPCNHLPFPSPQRSIYSSSPAPLLHGGTETQKAGVNKSLKIDFKLQKGQIRIKKIDGAGFPFVPLQWRPLATGQDQVAGNVSSGLGTDIQKA